MKRCPKCRNWMEERMYEWVCWRCGHRIKKDNIIKKYNRRGVIHKKGYFWTSIFTIQKYVELMQKEGYELQFVDNQIYYWSKK